jgi:hypothetical protein
MATHQQTGVTHPHGDAHHDAHGHHHSVSADRVPAFIGLIGGAIFIGAVLFGVVQWTNSLHGEHAEGAKAEATK